MEFSMKDKELRLCVLISCMHQMDRSIIERTHVQTDVVVVNQCDADSVEDFCFTNKNGRECKCKFICTTERGLSRSRNMAIRNCEGDICLICDDDEELADGYEQIILRAYGQKADVDVMTFAFDRTDKGYSSRPGRLTFKSIMQTSSVEITFKKDSVKGYDIWFDERMGSGTGNGAGEENKFLMDCKRAGLKMYYTPECIGRLLSTDSQWFHGFSRKYFEDLGWTIRRVMGGFKSLIYIFYFAFTHYDLYKKDITPNDAIRSYLRGWHSKR